MRFIVRDKIEKMYLSNSYYKNRDDKFTDNYETAHKFTSFELLLASKTVLKNRKRYMVYIYEDSIENLLKKEIKWRGCYEKY